MLEGFEQDHRNFDKYKHVTAEEAWDELEAKCPVHGRFTPEQAAAINSLAATYVGDMFTSDEEPGK